MCESHKARRSKHWLVTISGDEVSLSEESSLRGAPPGGRVYEGRRPSGCSVRKSPVLSLGAQKAAQAHLVGTLLWSAPTGGCPLPSPLVLGKQKGLIRGTSSAPSGRLKYGFVLHYLEAKLPAAEEDGAI